MIKNSAVIVSIFTVLIFPTSGSSHVPEEGKIYASGGGILFQTVPLITQNWIPFQAGGGIQVEGDLSSHGGAIVELYYHRRYYDRGVGGGLVVSAVNKLDVSLGYRYWLFKMLGLSLALTPSYSNGPYEMISNTSNGDTNTLASQTTDYGLTGAIQVEPVTIDSFSLVVDGRYTLTLGTNPGEDANQYGFFAGIKKRLNTLLVLELSSFS
jgi:hypothetical protein